MTHDDILTLARAGFNAQQIAALQAVSYTPAAPAAPAAPADPAAPAAPAPAAQAVPQMPPAPAPLAQVPSQSVDQILQAVNGLNANVQAALLQGSQQPPQALPTADQILAEIINPPQLNKEV